MSNRVLITYDVYKNHEEIKKELLKRGWKDSINGIDSEGRAVTVYLPNTTFWHENTTAQAARNMFQALAVSGNIERMICYEFVDWAGVVGYPHSDNKTELNLKGILS